MTSFEIPKLLEDADERDCENTSVTRSRKGKVGKKGGEPSTVVPVDSTGVSKRINDQARKNSTAKEKAVPRGSPIATPNKTEALLKLLRSGKGATLETLMNAVGWQAHSVRGFLSGTVKKKLGLSLISESGRDGIRRYRIDSAAKVA